MNKIYKIKNYMNVNFINSWKSHTKQFDKFKFEIRISFLTIINIEADWSKKYLKFVLFDFGFVIK